MTREEAIEIVKKHGISADGTKFESALRELIPELAESEDERIRKVVYKLMLGMRKEIFTSQDEIVTKEKVLAYLEKQAEEKFDLIDRNFRRGREVGYQEGVADTPEKLKVQKQEWSEEDELMMKAVIGILDENDHPKLCSWLKSLRPSWKPSEHQMTILKAVKDYVGVGSGYWGEALGSLIEDLEKL